MRHTDTIRKTTGIGHHMDRHAVATYQSRKVCGDEPVTHLDDGEMLILDDLYTFKIGSVVSSALRDGRDPVAAVDRARKLGHELVFIYGLGAMIYAGARKTPEPYIRVSYGMKVQFEGNVYTIEKAPNQNLQLKPVMPATVDA